MNACKGLEQGPAQSRCHTRVCYYDLFTYMNETWRVWGDHGYTQQLPWGILGPPADVPPQGEAQRRG